MFAKVQGFHLFFEFFWWSLFLDVTLQRKMEGK